jgi:benzoate/toluate 1,2-dioxygenase reductase subunit
MRKILRNSGWVDEHIPQEHLDIVAAFDRGDRDSARKLIVAHSAHAKATMCRAIENSTVA